MAKLPKKKGQAGAAKNYVNRSRASVNACLPAKNFGLSSRMQRLCANCNGRVSEVETGIYPREPRNKKKANKGSTAPTSFYYAKDIQYLLHEPVLQKLREHKAFAKKLSKAMGRNNYSLAKSLAEDRPVYRLDHIIKERYPTFGDALRDLDDALSLIVLFANLPANPAVPAAVVAHCARLATEWQYLVMRTRSLRKVFLSIKGIYFQAELKGQTITWLVPYAFTQHVPSDIDFRIMLTFLELYQTLLGFVFFRLFTELNLVYPTKVGPEDVLGLGSLLLTETSRSLTIEGEKEAEKWRPTGRKPTAKDVKRQIKQLAAAQKSKGVNSAGENEGVGDSAAELDPGAAMEDQSAALVPTDTSIDERTSIFAPFHFYLSREVTRPTLEFILRSFGAASVSWDLVLGEGSPMTLDDPRITHMIVDRPHVPQSGAFPGKRALVQPQWVVDCANAGQLLPIEPYAPGATLPPHLSPFVDAGEVHAMGGYIPAEAGGDMLEPASEEEDEMEPEAVYDREEEFAGFGSESGGPEDDEDEDEDDIDDEEEAEDDVPGPADEVPLERAAPALSAALANPTDEDLVQAAELEAEARGMPHGHFESLIAAARKADKPRKGKTSTQASAEDQLKASALLTGKRRKLYEQLKRRQAARADERDTLVQNKRRALAQQAVGR